MPTLFDPLTVGTLQLPNRIIMAPLTRAHASPGRIPNELMRDYYVQRASAGLIISEATSVTPMGVGYADTPGIWSDDQVAGWKRITDAVHRAGGQMLLQLWHVGRVSDPVFLDGALPVAPSAVAAQGEVSLLQPKRAFATPRALREDEIAGVIGAFRLGAENALKAGFDGVEVHGANGYLLDQFLQDSTNLRTDTYGGAIQKRARLLLEVTDACIAVWSKGRVGVHLAPRADAHDMGDSMRPETFGYVARALGDRQIAFICARESLGADRLGAVLKKDFGGAYIANEGFTKATGSALIETGEADAIAYGKLFIANPDLVRRFRLDAPLNAWESRTFYSPGSHGYTDYPSLDDASSDLAAG